MDKNTTLQGSGTGVLAVPGCRIISIRFVGLDLVEGQLKVLHDSVQKTGSLIRGKRTCSHCVLKAYSVLFPTLTINN